MAEAGDIAEALGALAAGRHLNLAEADRAFAAIMGGEATPAQIGALLSMIAVRGAHEDEIAGAAQVMRRVADGVTAPTGLRVIDTCGTGGDGISTFNISTATALVAGAAGLPEGVAVAKHGNRAVTSRSGSSQVLEALGVGIGAGRDVQRRCLEEAGVCFCFAPSHHPAMRHAAPVRRELGFRTIFNLLGPLTNPAGAKRQVIGVYDPAWIEPIARVLSRLGAERAAVVHGTTPAGGLDEASTSGPTDIAFLDGRDVTRRRLDPAELGLRAPEPDALTAASPEESAARIRGVLRGEPGAARDIVLLNSALALWAAGLAEEIGAGLERAAESIDRGAAARGLERLAELTRDAPGHA